jgi:hypothetical protein
VCAFNVFFEGGATTDLPGGELWGVVVVAGPGTPHSLLLLLRFGVSWCFMLTGLMRFTRWWGLVLWGVVVAVAAAWTFPTS